MLNAVQYVLALLRLQDGLQEGLNKNHVLYDLIYNPLETQFLKEGKTRGCKTSNGLKMLEYKAEKSWEIWNR